jgi:hypothetical protein
MLLGNGLMVASVFIEGLIKEERSSLIQQIRLWDDARPIIQLMRRGLRPLGLTQPYSTPPAMDFEHVPYYDLAHAKLARMANCLGVSPPGRISNSFLLEIGNKIENEAIHILQGNNKARRRNLSPEFHGETVYDVSRYVIEILFADIATSEAKTRETAVDEIAENLGRLDAQSQDRVKEKAQLDSLSADALRNAASIAAVGTGISGLVGVSGFAAYAALSSAISGTAGLVGMTLPFSVYMAASSTLAFMVNPVFVAAAVLGGGAVFERRAALQMRRQLIPLYVTLSALARDKNEHSSETLLLENAIARAIECFQIHGGEERRRINRSYPWIAGIRQQNSA